MVHLISFSIVAEGIVGTAIAPGRGAGRSSRLMLYFQPFIPGWISDLTASDPYYILPGALFVSMFLQARLQPASVDSAQQKILQYGMPIMFGVMGLFYGGGERLGLRGGELLALVWSGSGPSWGRPLR